MRCVSPKSTWFYFVSTTLGGGTSTDIVDLDDVHKTSITHVGTIVMFIAFAPVGKLNSSGKKLIEVIVAGFDVN